MRPVYSLLILLLFGSAASGQVLEAWYRLDEAAGSTCTDGAGNLHDGTYNGCNLAQPGAKPGTGTSVRFNGSSDKVDIPDGPGFTNLRQELSAACWVNADDFNGVQRFFGNDGSWTWGVTGTNIRFTTRTIKDYDMAAGLQAGTWYHICCVFDASFDVHFYLDGALLGTVQGNAQANPPLPDWHIGYKDPTYPEWFGGLLDDIQIYDGALTSDQVQWLYDNPGQSLGAGPVGANYCGPANINSSGGAGLIAGWGSDAVLDNSLTLVASGMPVNELGYFLCSQTQGFVSLPGGSSGNLCLGGKLGRFASQVQSTGAMGEFTIPVDLSDLPVWRHQAAQVGETWNFQAWFKDGATSNFSDGLAVVFQ